MVRKKDAENVQASFYLEKIGSEGKLEFLARRGSKA